ncbi:hypothetical protein, partial [Algoriphagus sp.]|uniref:hypothetical protein n=1 Tax=Algoriphagus sp. TaxID=1872435 RepID=UPI002734D6C1
KNIDCSASPGTLVFVTNAQQGGRVGRTQKRAGVRPCARKLFCVLIFWSFWIKPKGRRENYLGRTEWRKFSNLCLFI